MEKQHTVTFTKVQTGIFDVYVDGVKSDYQIINGSAGLSGHDTANIYGLVNHNTGYIKWLGPLVTAKKLAQAKFGGTFRKGGAR